MGITVTKRNYAKSGYSPDNTVEIMIDTASEISTVSTDYNPGSAVYTADCSSIWILNSKHVWVKTV